MHLPKLHLSPHLQCMQGCAPEVSVPPPSDPCPSGSLSSGEPTRLQHLLSVHPSTPINIQALASELSAHPDSVFTNHLLSLLFSGFQGFQITSLLLTIQTLFLSY